MKATSPIPLLRLFNLRSDQASPEHIDGAIRDATRLGGTNLWVLMFAIVIASVGLNVNSTAVIIGAMLISPLMGPIIGIGYGAGVHDYALIRQSLRNLAVFVGISLLASSAYFLVSPLSQAYSELLARTSPTIWDVLIAFFGGAAGMIGLTRKEKTTLIPGVAIATALMPPLCTTGYGIATGQPKFFLGAFFLFLINGVFIALATLAIVRVLRLPAHGFPDEAARRRRRFIITAAVTATLLPSIYLAYGLVHEQVFAARAERFVKAALLGRDDLSLLRSEIDPAGRRIALTVFGSGFDATLERELAARLQHDGLAGAVLEVRHQGDGRVDLDALKSELQHDLLRGVVAATRENAARIAGLEGRLVAKAQAEADLAAVEAEIRAQLPALRAVSVAAAPPAVLVAIDPPRPLPAAEIDRLVRWLKARLPQAELRLVIGRFAG